MKEQDEVSRGRDLIIGHFALDEKAIELAELSYNHLEERLTSIVTNLLNKDMAKLLNALYRIDVDEKIFKEILSHSAPNEIGRQLSREIIKRELQKVRTRAKYSD